MRDALKAVLQGLPPVPSLTPIYKSTQTTTTNEDTTTFSGVDIGVPHPKRVVVVTGSMGVSVSIGDDAVTVNGCATVQCDRAQSCFMATVPVPTGTTANIVCTFVGSARKAAAVYVLYPWWPKPIEVNGVNANLAVDANIANVTAVNKGCLIYGGTQLATLGAFTTTWGGGDAVTENVDAQLEAATSYTSGNINFTVSSNTNAINMAETVSGTKHLLYASFLPPYRGA
jgi:hypothetical protein